MNCGVIRKVSSYKTDSLACFDSVTYNVDVHVHNQVVHVHVGSHSCLPQAQMLGIALYMYITLFTLHYNNLYTLALGQRLRALVWAVADNSRLNHYPNKPLLALLQLLSNYQVPFSVTCNIYTCCLVLSQ
jgi:hypothetical protein